MPPVKSEALGWLPAIFLATVRAGVSFSGTVPAGRTAPTGSPAGPETGYAGSSPRTACRKVSAAPSGS